MAQEKSVKKSHLQERKDHTTLETEEINTEQQLSEKWRQKGKGSKETL